MLLLDKQHQLLLNHSSKPLVLLYYYQAVDWTVIQTEL